MGLAGLRLEMEAGKGAALGLQGSRIFTPFWVEAGLSLKHVTFVTLRTLKWCAVRSMAASCEYALLDLHSREPREIGLPRCCDIALALYYMERKPQDNGSNHS